MEAVGAATTAAGEKGWMRGRAMSRMRSSGCRALLVGGFGHGQSYHKAAGVLFEDGVGVSPG